ncbi:MAG: hypothetical protein PVG66_16605 [Chromatiales bacterium]|jgi:hypothetical protein
MKIPLRLLDWKKVKKTGKGYTHREMTVVRLLEQLFDQQGVSSFLNVGFHDYQDRRNRWWIDLCRANGIDWYIMEIFEPNCRRFRDKAPEADHFRIIQGDIREIDKVLGRKFDVVLHWHGPEHILKEEYLEALPNIEAAAEKMLILGCPNGLEEQGAAYGNPYEEHISFWTEDEFQKLGYQTISVQDKVPGHLTAWKQFSS